MEQIELTISKRLSKEGKPYLVLSNVVRNAIGQYTYPVTFDRDIIRKLFGFSEIDIVRMLDQLEENAYVSYYVEGAD